MDCIKELEEKIKIDKFTVADEVEFNSKEEANAISNYNRLLKLVEDSELPRNKKEVIESAIYEIIGDELNHQEKLKMLYSLITSIKEKKD